MKPKCWDAICYAAGTVRGSVAPVTLTQSDCQALVAYTIQLAAHGTAGTKTRAEPQGAPHATLEEAWDEGFEEGEGARRENPYRQKTKGASVRVSRVDGEPIGIELPGPQGAPTCCQGTDCGRCVGCLRVAKGAPQKPEQET